MIDKEGLEGFCSCHMCRRCWQCQVNLLGDPLRHPSTHDRLRVVVIKFFIGRVFYDHLLINSSQLRLSPWLWLWILSFPHGQQFSSFLFPCSLLGMCHTLEAYASHLYSNRSMPKGRVLWFYKRGKRSCDSPAARSYLELVGSAPNICLDGLGW